MKYRRLTRGELEELEEQFVRFLAAQSIPAQDWAKLKVTEEARANTLIDQFSEMVFHDVVTRANYLEHRTKNQLLTYSAGEQELELRGILVEGDAQIDFSLNSEPEKLLRAVQASNAKLKYLRASRAYKTSRNAEVFDLLEKGARISPSAELYTLLDTLKS